MNWAKRTFISLSILCASLTGVTAQLSYDMPTSLVINKELSEMDYSSMLPLPIDEYGHGFNWKGLAITGYHIATVTIGAIADGIYDDGNKQLGHFLEGTELALAMLGPLLVFDLERNDWLAYALSYTFVRVALFDPIYNTTRGLPVNYIGSTSTWDKFLQELDSPPAGYWIGRTLFLTAGIAIPIKEIK